MTGDPALRAALRHVAETRSTAFRDVELTGSPDGTGGESLTFRGYASVTDSPYTVEDWLGEYTETVARGAFARTLAQGADVPLKLNHSGITLARTKSGTMRLAEDSVGLHVQADLDPSSPEVQTLRSAMQRGDVDEMSFAFRVTGQTWSPDYTERSITEVDLNKGDVSVVNFGANPATNGATLRGLDVTDLLRSVPPGTLITRALLESLAVERAHQDEPEEADLSLYHARLRLLGL